MTKAGANHELAVATGTGNRYALSSGNQWSGTSRNSGRPPKLLLCVVNYVCHKNEGESLLSATQADSQTFRELRSFQFISLQFPASRFPLMAEQLLPVVQSKDAQVTSGF
jgi:hypothetical protein